MRLGPKLALALGIPLIALTVLFGLFYQQRSDAMLRRELTREGRSIAFVLQLAAEDYLRDRQIADLRKMADRVAGYERVLGLRVFDHDGRLIYESPTLDSLRFEQPANLAQVLDDGQTLETRRLVGTQPAVGYLFPLIGARGHIRGAIHVLQLEAVVEDDRRAHRQFVLLASLAMGLTTLLIVSLVTRFSVARPIGDLVRAFRAATRGALPSRVPVRSDDELGRLAREFNGMVDRLEVARGSLEAEQAQRHEVEDRLRNAERLASLGRLAAGLAHEIGTPLNVIGGRAESLRRALPEHPQAGKSLGIIATQTERIARIVRDMLEFARRKPARRAPTDLAAVLRTVLELLETRFEQARVRVRLEPADLPPIVADGDRLQQVFLNLALNAVDAMPGGGALVVSTGRDRTPHPERGGEPVDVAWVAFQDDGEGIAPEDVSRIFDPFFTTKETGRGVGLGLSVSYGIVEDHGGWFDVASAPAGGTRVAVFLPFAAARSGTRAATEDDGRGAPAPDGAAAPTGAAAS
jgi:signal transduction histidine kinase